MKKFWLYTLLFISVAMVSFFQNCSEVPFEILNKTNGEYSSGGIVVVPIDDGVVPDPGDPNVDPGPVVTEPEQDDGSGPIAQPEPGGSNPYPGGGSDDDSELPIVPVPQPNPVVVEPDPVPPGAAGEDPAIPQPPEDGVVTILPEEGSGGGVMPMPTVVPPVSQPGLKCNLKNLAGITEFYVYVEAIDFHSGEGAANAASQQVSNIKTIDILNGFEIVIPAGIKAANQINITLQQPFGGYLKTELSGQLALMVQDRFVDRVLKLTATKGLKFIGGQKYFIKIGCSSKLRFDISKGGFEFATRNIQLSLEENVVLLQ